MHNIWWISNLSFLKEIIYFRSLNLNPEKLISALSVLNNTGRKHEFRMILSYNYIVAGPILPNKSFSVSNDSLY